MKKPIWHLALAAVMGIALRTGSTLSYVYIYQQKVDSSLAQIQGLEKRTQRLEQRSRAAAPPPHWWEFWRPRG